MANIITPRFSRTQEARLFFTTLNENVQSYFSTKNIKKTGNYKLYTKTIVFSTVYIASYALLFFLPSNAWFGLSLAIILGMSMAGLGMNVMHDGNHGSYSSKAWVNKIMGSSIYILAGNVHNWRVQHNVLHHTFTNVHGHDEDLDAGKLIRFSDNVEWRWYHKYQHIYAILLYGFLTLNWALVVDFVQITRYSKRNLNCEKAVPIATQWTLLIVTKIVYYAIWIVIPMLFLDYAWWQILIGFFVMHYIAGLILSVIFQLAHVMEDTEVVLPDDKNQLKNAWAAHQLYTTSNFAPKNKLVSWFSGGLNYQIEHHLFPNISHVHYKKISGIIKKTAKQFKLPYYEYKTFRQAISTHFNHLKKLGKNKPTL